MQEQEQIRRGVPGRNSQKSVPWYSTLESHCVLTLLQNFSLAFWPSRNFSLLFFIAFFGLAVWSSCISVSLRFLFFFYF